MTPRKSLQFLGVMTLGLFVGVAAVGCKGAEKGRKSSRTAKASIQAFDPNADVAFEFGDGGGGGEIPDEYGVKLAFESRFDAFDGCVAEYKERKGIAAEKQLDGEVSISVKLNPKASAPSGINLDLSSKRHDDEQLKTCMKKAIDEAPFPTYDGAPRVVDFSTELDPGSAIED